MALFVEPTASSRPHGALARGQHRPNSFVDRVFAHADHDQRCAQLLLTREIDGDGRGLWKSEVLRAQWAEFDLERAVWETPAVRMKMKRPRRVYLRRQAVELLQLLRAVTGVAEGYVFPSL